MKDWLKRAWQHRTKIIGGIAMAAGYAQNNLAQLGHVLPEKYHGMILSGLGVLVFFIGLYNSAAAQDGP